MYELRIHPEASEELEEVLQRLADDTLWQAGRFADIYHSALKKICSHPECSHYVWQEFRRFNLRPFSVALIYRHRENEIFLVALMHERRDPDYWKSRVTD
jgi:plasmid stabilization system protein ParE